MGTVDASLTKIGYHEIIACFLVWMRLKTIELSVIVIRLTRNLTTGNIALI